MIADGRFLMFLNDGTGDENRHLFIVDPKTHALRDVTPLANVSVQLSLWSPEAPGQVAVKINDRDARGMTCIASILRRVSAH